MKLLTKTELEKLKNIKIVDISNIEKILNKTDFIEYIKKQYELKIPREKQDYIPSMDFDDLNINNMKLNVLIKLLNINILEYNIVKKSDFNTNIIKEKINNYLKQNLLNNEEFKKIKFTKENEKNRKSFIIDDKILNLSDMENIKNNIFNKKSPLIIRDNNINIDNKKYNFDIIVDENFDITVDYIKRLENNLNLNSELNIN